MNFKIQYYWKNEISGRMQEIVMKFLGEKDLQEEELEILKRYVVQWIKALDQNGNPVPPSYEKDIMGFSQLKLMKYCGTKLLDYCIDPF